MSHRRAEPPSSERNLLEIKTGIISLVARCTLYGLQITPSGSFSRTKSLMEKTVNPIRSI
jgi:hypothetical protein